MTVYHAAIFFKHIHVFSKLLVWKRTDNRMLSLLPGIFSSISYTPNELQYN